MASLQGFPTLEEPSEIIDVNNKSVLTYGSVIYLTFKETNNTKYYAYSEGLTKTKVLLKTKDSFKREGLYMRGLFRIYPSFYQNEYAKAKAKFEEIISNDNITQNNKRETRTQIPKLIKGISEELASNLDSYEKLKGTPVRYGRVIQLLHVGSQKYLSYDPESSSDLESDCLKIELKHESSDFTCFRIMPSFKYQQENNGYIYNKDCVYLMSTVETGSRIFGDPFLHASRTIGTFNKDNPNKDSLEKKEINVSSDKKTQWRVKIFSDYLNDKVGVLSIGEIIWINLSEEDKNLIAYNTNDNQGSYSFKFVLCSASDRYKKFTGNSNGMFIIESLKMSHGGFVKWKTAYKLKHLTTNKYLSVGPQPAWDIDEKRDNGIYSFKLVNSKKDAADFSFEILFSTISTQNKQLFTKYVPKDAYFKLRVESDLWVTYRDIPRDYLESKEQYGEDFIALPVIGKMKENNVFHCSRASQNEVIVTMFLISCKSTIKNTLKYLDPDFMAYLDSDLQQLQLKHKVVIYKLERMTACLKQLELFCSNKLLEYLSIDQIYGQINPYVQNILKEQLFIETLASTLIICFPKRQYLDELRKTETERRNRKAKKDQDQTQSLVEISTNRAENKNLYKAIPEYKAETGPMYSKADMNAFTAEINEDINHKKKKICDLAYKVIIAICKNNIPNKNYAFQYLSIFQMQAEFMSFSIDCVNMILKNNEMLLMNLHKTNANPQIYNQNVGNQSIDPASVNHRTLERAEKRSRLESVSLTKGKRLSSSGVFSGLKMIRNASTSNLPSEAVGEDPYEFAYIKFYNKMLKFLEGDLANNLAGWNPIQFFSALLQRTDDSEKQKKLLYFFKTISLQNSEGMNMNQEIIHKYFTNNNGDREKSTIIETNLVRIFTKGDGKLYVKIPFAPHKDRVFELKEFIGVDDGASENSSVIHVERDDSLSSDGDHDEVLSKIHFSKELLVSHVDLCAALCKSRNYSWKYSLEKEIKWEPLLNYLIDDLPADVKAALSRLMTTLYVDQEPRRVDAIPLFCKVVDRKKLAIMESEKNSHIGELQTIKTENTFAFKDGSSDINIQRFKTQLLNQIKDLDKTMQELPLVMKKENMVVFDRKSEKLSAKAYNSYVLEIIETTHLMLKFDIIKILAKRIDIQPLPKDSDSLDKKRKNRMKSRLNFNVTLQLFQRTKTVAQTREFEEILRSIMLLLEYDKTYPEATKALSEMRKEKKAKEAEKASLLSTRKMLKTLQKGINLVTNQIITNTTFDQNKTKKKAIELDFLDKELNTNEIYLKQGDVMKRILENLIGQQELDIEATIKMKVLDILEYFFDFKQDRLLSNMRRVFYTMIKESNLVETYRHDESGVKVKEKLINILSHSMKFILPRISATGTPIDENDQFLKDDFGQDILDVNECLDFELLPVLFQQLCLNNNVLLQRKILHLMTRMYNQRNEFARSMQSLLFLFEKSDIENYNKAKSFFRVLQRNSEESENWLKPMHLEKPALDDTKRTLVFFYNSIFNASNIEGMDDEELIDYDIKLIDSAPPNKIRQDMFRHLKVFLPVISLIKDNMNIIESTKDKRILDLFTLCFAFLTAFVKGNELNQFILFNSLKISNISTDLGHARLFIEIFRDNKLLCKPEKVYEALEGFLDLILTNGRRVEYLEFFKVIQETKGERILDNQRMVLDMFSDPKHKNTLLYFDKDQQSRTNGSKLAQSSEKSAGFTNTFNFRKGTAIKAGQHHDEPYFYHAKLFEVLGLTSIGKEGLTLNELRLRSLIDFSYLLEILIQEDGFTSTDQVISSTQESSIENFEVMKIPIAQYIYYVYLESEKIVIETTPGRATLKDLISREKKRICYLKSYKESYLVYLFDNLLLILYEYFKQSRKNQMQDTTHEKRREYDELLSFIEIFMLNFNKFDYSKVSRNGKQNIQDLLNFIKQDKDYGQINLTIKDLKHVETVQSARDIPQNRSQSEEEIWKTLWERFVVEFSGSKLLTEEIDKEKKIFAKSLTHIDNIFRKDPITREIINNEEVLKKFINFVIETENSEETSETIVLVLEALGNFIDNGQQVEEQMIEKQNFLNRMNAVYMIFSKLSDSNLVSSEQVFRQLVIFAIKLLEGGNLDVQKNVYRHFTSFNNSEVFFLKLHDRFSVDIQTVNNFRENPDSIVQENDIEEMKNILRLLQLFAEGHFSDLQDYIRAQTNSYHSYDLLNDISDLLNVCMQVKRTEFFEVMIQCFDTITEFIQGPCFENQVAIIQGSFLDLAANLLLIDELGEEEMIKSGKKKLSESNLKKWQLARLKYKCSITLMSLLEARKDDNNVYRMMKAIPIEALKMNVTDVFKMFRDQYKGQYSNKIFLHFDQDEEVERSEEYYSLIIETGFNLYFLLNIFSGAKLANDDGIGLQEEEDEEQQEEEADEDNNGKGSVLMNIFKPLFSSKRTTVQTDKRLAKNGVQKTEKPESKEKAKPLQIEELNKDPKPEEAFISPQITQKRAKLWSEAAKFFDKNSAHIEVLREDGHLEKTYFYIPPFCHAISKDTKVEFSNEVNRTSAKVKCAHLLKKSPELIENIKYQDSLQRLLNRIPILSILINRILVWRDIAFVLAIIINLIVITTYHRDELDPHGYSSKYEKIVRVLGFILIGLSLLIVAYFMLKTAPLLIKKAWKNESKKKMNLSLIIFNMFKTLFYLLSDFYVLYYCFYGASAIIGITISPFFFSIHLLDVLVRFPLLQSVLKSIWIPGKSLLLTFLLFQLLNYLFTLVGYYWFIDAYPEGSCSSIWTCYLTAVDKPFKHDGALGGFLIENTNMTFPRFLFDNLYNLFVMIIMLNIVVGIIIDNFGTLRDEEKKYIYDTQNICFICGNDRETLEKASDAKGVSGSNGFTKHIKKDHYLWNYLFYIGYIVDKTHTEYTGLESYIAEQIEKGDISWFPTHRALILKDSNNSQDSSDNIEALRRIEAEQKLLLKNASNLSKNMVDLKDLVSRSELRRSSNLSKQFTMRSLSSGVVHMYDGNSYTQQARSSIRNDGRGGTTPLIMNLSVGRSNGDTSHGGDDDETMK